MPDRIRDNPGIYLKVIADNFQDLIIKEKISPCITGIPVENGMGI